MRDSQVYQFGPFQLIPSERLLLRGTEIVELPPKVFDTLVMLVRESGHVVAKDEIMQAIWPDSYVEEGNLTRNISVLRKALISNDSPHQYIDTVPKVGYRFVADVSQFAAQGATAIEKLTVTRTSTVAEDEIGIQSYRLSSIAQRLRGWPAKVSLAIATVAILTVAGWLLLPRLSPRTQEVRGASIVATFNQLSDQPGSEVFPSLSPDGKQIVYARKKEGNWDIYLQRVGGRTAINLTADSPTEDTHPAFSPDGNLIAFRSWRDGGGIFVMGATGENIRRVSDFGHHPAWSPDGKEIVCSMTKIVDPGTRSVVPSQLWAISVQTGARRLISEGDAAQPQWSPNGHRIAYWGLHKGGQRDIWTISSDGGQGVLITDDAHFNWNPIWSPDGGYLYFVSDRSGSMNLWRVPIDERSGKVLGEPEPVTTPSPYSQHISFSRDGRQIAYVQVATRLNIKRVSFDSESERLGGEVGWVTQGDKHTGSPDISPDGQWIIFDSQEDKQEDIFVIKTDGSGLRQLTDDAFRDRGPRWSADGKQIAFYSDRGGKYEIWTINFDGTGLKQLTTTTASVVFYPVWSPDNSRLLYRTTGSPASIMKTGLAWSEQSPEMLPPISSDSQLSFTPWSWSPDGRTLAGWQRVPEDPHAGIHLYSLDSKRFEKLTDLGNRPVWLSDNRRLLYFYREKLYLLDTRSRKVKELLSTAPDEIQGLTLSKDDNLICFSIEISESDIWVATVQ
jgi:eukaryotic-like serine/threonine-protein kinase